MVTDDAIGRAGRAGGEVDVREAVRRTWRVEDRDFDCALFLCRPSAADQRLRRRATAPSKASAPPNSASIAGSATLFDVTFWEKFQTP